MHVDDVANLTFFVIQCIVELAPPVITLVSTYLWPFSFFQF